MKPSQRPDLFELPIPFPDPAHDVPLSDDQDPSLPTPDGGPIAGALRAQGALLERFYVGERMAATVWRLRFDRGADVDRESYLRHEGAADVLAMAAPRLSPFWRGAKRLDALAYRVLLGRARARLSEPPRPAADAFEWTLDAGQREEALAVYTNAALALGRDPDALREGPF